MPVPSNVGDLSPNPAGNSPTGNETVGPNLDDYLRTGFAFTRQLAVNFAGASAPVTPVPYMQWADSANQLIKRRDPSNTVWITEAEMFTRAYPTTGGIINGQVSVYKDNQSGFANAAIIAGTASSTVGDAVISLAVSGADAAQILLSRADTTAVKILDASGLPKNLEVKAATAANHAVIKSQMDAELATKQPAGSYVTSTNTTPISVTWDGSQFQAAGGGAYRGALWHSGNFDPSTKATKGALVQHDGAIVEAGPTYFIQLVDPSQVDFPNPFVMIGMRRVNNSAIVYLRGISLKMI